MAKEHIIEAIGKLMQGYAGENNFACISIARQNNKTMLTQAGDYTNISRIIAHCMIDDPVMFVIIQDALVIYKMDKQRREILN